MAWRCCRKNTPKTLNLKQMIEVQNQLEIKPKNGNSTKPLLTAVFYCQMLNFSAFHRFFLIL